MAEANTHRALVYHSYGNALEVLNIETIPRPVLTRSHDVLVRVKACAIGQGEFRVTAGDAAAISPVVFPGLLGHDFAGIVEDLSEEMAREGRIAKGDEVFGSAMGLRSGAIAEYFVVDGRGISKKPKNISFVQAAAVPVSAQTAFQALKQAGLKAYSVDDPTQPDDLGVLVTAGAGGVGTFTIQIAKQIFRANRILTTCSEPKAALLKKIGATEVVDYHKEPVAQYLKKKEKQGQGEKFDAIIDITCETLSLFPFVKPKVGGISNVNGYIDRKCLKMWAEENSSQGLPFSNVLLGIITYLPWTFDLISGTTRAKFWAYWYGAHFGGVMGTPNYEELDIIASYLEAGKIEPVIDSVHKFENWRAAFEKGATGHATGKVVIDLSTDEDSTS